MDEKINQEIEKLIIEIKSGNIHGIQYITSMLEDKPMSHDEYIKLLVRVLLHDKIKQKMEQDEKRNNFIINLSITVVCCLLIKFVVL